MKTPSITNSNYSTNLKRNLNQAPDVQATPTTSIPAKGDQVSFKGGVKDGLTSAFKFIDDKGFFVEFLIVDTISMILPRILVGLNRDKDKTGKLNYKAAKEEAGREILSGPSMNLIPMGILAIASALKPASKMERATLDGFRPHMESVIAELPKDKLTDKVAIQKGLADKLFDEIFGKDANIEEIKKSKNDFADKLAKATSEATPKIFENKDKNAYCIAQNEFDTLVDKLNNMRKEAPANAKSVSVNEDGNTATKLFDDFRKYSSDIIEKFVKEPDKKDFIKTLTESRQKIKTATALSAFFAVGSFLLVLPKIYQQGGLSPAQESAMRASKQAKGDA